MPAPKTILFVAVIALLFAAPTWAQKSVEPVRIVYGRGKNVFVQNASGGAERKATASEFGEWKAAKMKRISLESPDGTMTAREDGVPSIAGADWQKKTFKDWGKSGSPKQFAGWFPDSKYYAISGIGDTNHYNVYTRAVIDAKTGNLMPFNGWLAKNNESAIVTNQEGLMDEYYRTYGAGAVPDPQPSNIQLHVAALPGTIEGYSFKTANRRPLIANGKPFRPMTYGDFIFSENSKWAIRSNDYDKGYIFSTATGAGRQTGVSPVFIPPVAVHGKSIALSENDKGEIDGVLYRVYMYDTKPFKSGKVTDESLIKFARYVYMEEDGGEKFPAQFVDNRTVEYFGVRVKQHQTVKDENTDEPMAEFKDGSYSCNSGSTISEGKQGPKIYRYAKRGSDYLVDLYGNQDREATAYFARRATLRKVTENGKSRFVIVEYLPLP